MSKTEDFTQAIKTGYTFKSESFKIGVGMLDGAPVSNAGVFLPFKTLNRQ